MCLLYVLFPRRTLVGLCHLMDRSVFGFPGCVLLSPWCSFSPHTPFLPSCSEHCHSQDSVLEVFVTFNICLRLSHTQQFPQMPMIPKSNSRPYKAGFPKCLVNLNLTWPKLNFLRWQYSSVPESLPRTPKCSVASRKRRAEVGASDVIQWLECLPSLCKALGLVPSSA